MARTRTNGFTLIEILIALFLVGVMLILFQAVVGTAASVRTVKSQGIALSIARNEIEVLRAGGYAALPSSTTSFSDTLLTALPLHATTTLSVTTYNSKMKQVSVSVIWRDAGSTASSTITLTTLIAQTGGLP